MSNLLKVGDNVDVKFISKRSPEISEKLKTLNIAPFLGKQPHIGEILGFAPKRNENIFVFL